MNSTQKNKDKHSSATIQRIVFAAEAEFSDCGFDGAGMKAISVRADVSQALLHYHFGSKDSLYAAVIEQRSRMINNERLLLLDQVNFSAGDALEKVLEALFRPPLGPAGGNGAYARIFAGLVVGQEREHALVQKYYDATAQKFVVALERAIPDANRASAAMGFTLALGALLSVIGRDGRAERLMGRDSLQDFDAVLSQLVGFAKGGVLEITRRSGIG